MNPIVIAPLFEIGKSLIQRLFPDKEAQARAEAELAVMATTQEFQLIAKQLEINAAEAASPSFWVSGWRPGVGWVCVVALGLSYIPKALVMTAIWTYQCVIIIGSWNGIGVAPAIPAYPDLGVTDLIGLLMALLGIGGMRMLEKLNRVASK